MKLFKHQFFILLAIFNIYSQHFFTLNEGKQPVACVFTLNVNSRKLQNDYFHEAIFDFSYLIDIAERHNLPVILAIPENNQNTKTTDKNAPLIEGSRVALTWASVGFRQIKNLDVRVLLLPDNFSEQELDNALKQVYLKRMEDKRSFEKRIFSFKDISKEDDPNKDLNLTEIFVDPIINRPIIITPKCKINNNQKRILITGGAGFIGSHLSRALLDKGHYVIVLDNLLCASKSNITDLLDNENFEFHKVDVSLPFDVKGLIDIIVHLASVPSPEFYYRLPIETLCAGLHGTKNTLDLAVRKKARYLFSSTSEIYGDPKEHPQNENYAGNVNPIGIRAQYDESKRGAETLIKIYFENYNIDARIVRIFNTYGPGMSLNDGRVVTNFIKNILQNKPMKIYGNGMQTRSFTYISDMIDGILKVLEADELSSEKNIEGRIFNVGNTDEFTIVDLAKKLQNIGQTYLNYLPEIEFVEQIDSTDPKLRCPDIRKISSKLNYHPKVKLDEGIEDTFMHFLNQ
ncbi:GDP-mannose 4,6-dehydratase [Candidatus Dependentiae bacterium]|nr:GDP-mannose 4,6-dehydratase [Candidatus Dependentiae bacterium]